MEMSFQIHNFSCNNLFCRFSDSLINAISIVFHTVIVNYLLMGGGIATLTW